MQSARKHAYCHTTFLSAALGSALALLLAQPAFSAAPADAGMPGPAQPAGVERHVTLGMRAAGEVRWQETGANWQAVTHVAFAAVQQQAPGPATNHAIRTGPLSWNISAEGARVLDNRTGASALISELTSAEVRPRDLVYDKRAGTVWLYGTSLYRYQLASHMLEELQPAGAGWQAIRKIARGPSGLWLATARGIFLLDAADGALKQVSQEQLAGQGLINVATGEKEAWFATVDQRLVRIGMLPARQFELAVSKQLPGTVAELAVNGQSLWLLLGDKHGDHYKLAYVEADLARLGLMAGRYFSLAERGGQLVAQAYATEYRIDAASKTVTPVPPSAAGQLAHALRNQNVLFAGSSYGYKDGCEIVERGQLDVSKGWINAMNEPGWR